MSLPTRLFCAAIIGLGLSTLGSELLRWSSADLVRFCCYFLVAILASMFKVSLPAITGKISVTFLFILVGVVELSLPETLVIGCAAALTQCLYHPQRRLTLVQLAFHTANTSIAVVATYWVFHLQALSGNTGQLPLALILAAATLFATTTFPVAAMIALKDEKGLGKAWRDGYFLPFSYYVVGAALAGLFAAANRILSWQVSMLVLPVVYLIYRSYVLYVGRMDDERKHAEEMASLHLRTIEALALAIEAKDHTTHDHLQRVQVYAIEIGKELGLSESDLEALQAAALLHDIGKLAVPEHIISKPGKLTPEEFEKMKIHPTVGAEILERVQFPYPVVPIVRSHHEKWDGTGYPHGLRGEAIPIGARILAAVDCLDALATDRQYRRALPLNQAMGVVVSESGKAYDPMVVEVLQRRYIDLEQMAQAKSVELTKLSTDIKVERGLAPASGFESTRKPVQAVNNGDSVDFLVSIAAARQEVQALFELSQDLGNSLSLNETLSVLAVRLKRMVPFDSMAIYVRRDNVLKPEYVSGENFRLFSSLEIGLGCGLSGWVADNRKPIVNGNPAVEPGYINDPSRFTTLRSAMAVPLEGLHGVVGVLTLYHVEKDAFSKDHLRILLAITSKVSMSIENALKYRQAESSATTDYLTGLPNARSLFLHLDSELARSRRARDPLAILVCDLNGFKQVNDNFGHLEGNKVLRAVAQGLRESCREYDYVARMGGDEFVLVLPGLRPQDIPPKIALLARLVEAAGRDVCGDNLLSVSVGDAHFPDDGIDAEQLLAEADRRMYKAKQQQRLTLNSDQTWDLGLQAATTSGTIQ